MDVPPTAGRGKYRPRRTLKCESCGLPYRSHRRCEALNVCVWLEALCAVTRKWGCNTRPPWDWSRCKYGVTPRDISWTIANDVNDRTTQSENRPRKRGRSKDHMRGSSATKSRSRLRSCADYRHPVSTVEWRRQRQPQRLRLYPADLGQDVLPSNSGRVPEGPRVADAPGPGTWCGGSSARSPGLTNWIAAQTPLA